MRNPTPIRSLRPPRQLALLRIRMYSDMLAYKKEKQPVITVIHGYEAPTAEDPGLLSVIQ
jgi:hypothetical protein